MEGHLLFNFLSGKRGRTREETVNFKRRFTGIMIKIGLIRGRELPRSSHRCPTEQQLPQMRATTPHICLQPCSTGHEKMNYSQHPQVPTRRSRIHERETRDNGILLTASCMVFTISGTSAVAVAPLSAGASASTTAVAAAAVATDSPVAIETTLRAIFRPEK